MIGKNVVLTVSGVLAFVGGMALNACSAGYLAVTFEVEPLALINRRRAGKMGGGDEDEDAMSVMYTY